MAKNRLLIEQEKRLRKNISELTPAIYAGIALALHRKHRWGFKRINDLFVESQIIWNECVELDINMRDLCFNETGIDVQKKVEEKNG
jgi:hypothetical protein